MGKPSVIRHTIVKPIHNLTKRTGGTETSKYPEEKKSTEIPPVAASERGAAQNLNQFVC
jgi:hypothetical protein